MSGDQFVNIFWWGSNISSSSLPFSSIVTNQLTAASSPISSSCSEIMPRMRTPFIYLAISSCLILGRDSGFKGQVQEEKDEEEEYLNGIKRPDANAADVG
jgi:hypothetical protein